MKTVIYFFIAFFGIQQTALGAESLMWTTSKLSDQAKIERLYPIQVSTQHEVPGIPHSKLLSFTKTTYVEHPEGYSLVITKRSNGKVVRRFMTGDYTAIWIRGNRTAIRGKISEISQSSIWIEDREVTISEIVKINRKEYSPFKKGLYAAGGVGSLALGALFTSDIIRYSPESNERDGFSTLAAVIGACMAIFLLALGVLLLSRFKKYRAKKYTFQAKND
ncbi:MAG: hypothetical protein AAGC85_22355 [Bacteroidota bacterium]